LTTKDTRNFFSEIPNPPILRVRDLYNFPKSTGLVLLRSRSDSDRSLRSRFQKRLLCD
jgi:hypothetical protein